MDYVSLLEPFGHTDTRTHAHTYSYRRRHIATIRANTIGQP